VRTVLKHLRLEHVGPAPLLDLELAERLNVLTGDNGLGKSFILDVAWWVLTRTWAGRPAMGQRVRSRAPSMHWTLQGARAPVDGSATLKRGAWPTDWTRSGGQPPLVGLVLYVRIDGGFSLWDPALDKASAYHFTRGEVWEGKPIDGPGKICDGLIRDWVYWESKAPHEFQLLTDLLGILSSEPSEHMSPGGSPGMLEPDDVRPIPMLKLPYGEVPVLYASAAMRRVLALAYMLVWASVKHRERSAKRGIPPETRMVLLFDEVEDHMHPRWQRVVVPAILQAIERMQHGMSVQVLMTTHSPMVLASLEPHFDESRDRIFRFRLQDQRVQLDHIDWELHGDATGWLTSDVFELPAARSPEAEQAIADANALLDRGRSEASDVQKLQRKLGKLLSPLDPFWSDWRFGLARIDQKTEGR
jgi:AAA domain, putative AbiEii toxin, Type IV TA system